MRHRPTVVALALVLLLATATSATRTSPEQPNAQTPESQQQQEQQQEQQQQEDVAQHTAKQGSCAADITGKAYPVPPPLSAKVSSWLRSETEGNIENGVGSDSKRDGGEGGGADEGSGTSTSSRQQPLHGRVPKNLTSVYTGNWTLDNDLSVDGQIAALGLESSGGKVELRLEAKPSSLLDVHLATGTLSLTEAEGHDEVVFFLEGAVYSGAGVVFVSGEPQSDDMFHSGLPPFVANVSEEAAHPKPRTLGSGSSASEVGKKTYSRSQQRHINNNNMLIPSVFTECVVRVYLRTWELPTTEEGMPMDADPLGAYHSREPRVGSSGFVFSPNCGFALELSLKSLDLDDLFYHLYVYAAVMMFVSGYELWAVARQLDAARNQTARVKVSVLCIGHLTVLSTLHFLYHIYLAHNLEEAYGPFILLAFLQLMVFAPFELRYVGVLWRARRPQVFAAGQAAVNREFNILYSQFYFAVIACGLLFSNTRDYPVIPALFSLSSTIPQIVHNAQHDTNRALVPAFGYGLPVVKLLGTLHTVSLRAALTGGGLSWLSIFVVIVYVSVQVGLLYMQDKDGARFFIPRDFSDSLLQDKYDYHVELPASFIEAPTPCVICLSPIVDESVLEGGDVSGGGGGLNGDGSSKSEWAKRAGLRKEDYMCTPCEHVFHTECLSQWLEIRLACPTCRQDLPVP